MQAKVRREGEAFVIHLSGKVDFDSSESFRETVLKHVKGSSVVFNMKDLTFVGSNGITPFVETFQELCSHETTMVRFCHMSSEFERIFEANQIPLSMNFISETQAIQSTLFTPYQVMPQFEESDQKSELPPVGNAPTSE